MPAIPYTYGSLLGCIEHEMLKRKYIILLFQVFVTIIFDVISVLSKENILCCHGKPTSWSFQGKRGAEVVCHCLSLHSSVSSLVMSYSSTDPAYLLHSDELDLVWVIRAAVLLGRGRRSLIKITEFLMLMKCAGERCLDYSTAHLLHEEKN